MSKIKVMDLFAGCGGFSCGFEMTHNFEIAYAIEFNKTAAFTYSHNHKGTTVIEKDIKTVDANFFVDKGIDVIIGGPPCQGFSVAGKRDLRDIRNTLPFEYIRFVKAIQPKVFVLENVKGLLSFANGKIFETILSELKNLKYKVSYKVLNTYNYSVPQTRERVFIVGVRKDLKKDFVFPTPSENKKSLEDVIGDIVNTGSYEETKQHNHDNINLLDENLYNKLGEGNLLCDVRHGKNHIHSWEIELKGKCTPKELLILNTISENRRKKQYGEKDGNPLTKDNIIELTKLKNIDDELEHLTKLKYLSKIDENKYDIHDRKINMGLRIFNGKEPINTITTQSGEHSTYAHYKKPRNLTIRELARIQTFPDNFIFYGNIKQMETQIGNAVPPLMAKRIAEEIEKVLH